MRAASSILPLALLAAAVSAGVGLARLDAADLPRGASGASALSVAFGDARKVISQGMLHKADVYFHGGLDSSERGAHRCSGHHAHHEGDHCEHCETEAHEHGEGEACEPVEEGFWSDPFGNLRDAVSAPRVDRHLDNDKAVELVPFIWAAAKADPHNIEAWEIGHFVIGTEMRREDLAWKLLEDGLAENPESASILEMMGQDVYKRGEGDVEAAKGYFTRAREAGLAEQARGALNAQDELGFLYALNYLVAIAAKDGDVEEMKRLADDARVLGRESFVTANVRERLSKIEGEKK